MEPKQLNLFAWAARREAAGGKPPAPPLDEAQLRRELAAASQEARNLTVMAMNPKHPPEKAELLKLLERSARAEVKLRQKALRYAQQQGQQ